MSNDPLLSDAPHLQNIIPLRELPDLLYRDDRYYTEPFCGLCVVGVLSASFVSAVSASCPADDAENWFCQTLVILIWLWAIIACLSTAFILFAGAGVVKRSPSTCYPIPEEVAQRLLAKPQKSFADMENIKGPAEKSYCVRCFVWRPIESHHCQICQRCVTGFDHHCGVFGRCIVDGNMICFKAVLTMLLLGFFTLIIAFMLSTGEPERSDDYVAINSTRSTIAVSLVMNASRRAASSFLFPV